MDIADRKRAETKLKQTLDNLENLVKERTEELEETFNLLKGSENQLQAILTGSRGLIFIKDLTGRFTLINKKLEELHGITCDEIREKLTRIYFLQTWLIILKYITL